jgi:hypothetical protein
VPVRRNGGPVAKVEVQGVARLQNALRKAEEAASDREFHKAAAELILFEARNRAPVGPSRRGHRGGTLRRSGRATATKGSGAVRFGGGAIAYAGPVHFGHAPRPQGGFTLPNPFLYDAADDRVDAVFQRFTEYVERVLAAQGFPVR